VSEVPVNELGSRLSPSEPCMILSHLAFMCLTNIKRMLSTLGVNHSRTEKSVSSDDRLYRHSVLTSILSLHLFMSYIFSNHVQNGKFLVPRNLPYLPTFLFHSSILLAVHMSFEKLRPSCHLFPTRAWHPGKLRHLIRRKSMGIISLIILD
jgi:hypothetical protein